jgi:hypothetical protein
VANDAAADVRAADARVPLSVSVQVEVAWGSSAARPPHAGVDQDFADFPFVRSWDSRPIPFVWTDPDSLPPDYYARLVAGRRVPVAVVEGGWTSASVGSNGLRSGQAVALHPGVRRRCRFGSRDLCVPAHVHRSRPDGEPAAARLDLALFAALGLVDVNLNPKLALSAWDAIFSRPQAP